MIEPSIYHLGAPGLCGTSLPEPDVPLAELPADLLRDELDLPEVGQLEVVRHFTKLSTLNYSIDKGFYPLGSCTMKYNPRINEDVARLPGLTGVHPLQNKEISQGSLFLIYMLQEWLKEIGGFAGVSLQPAAGAHGEFSGILMMRAYHLDRGDTKRTKILIPDSAHGTNPASTTMSGLEVIEIPSDARGNVDLEKMRCLCDDTVAGLMITNPNTLGLFEEHIEEIIALVRNCGGLVYGDGANMNALLGVARPGDLGFDVMHFNLHKTFSTPHGGGGPGSGPVGVSERMVPFLPGPIVQSKTVKIESDEPDEDANEIPMFSLYIPEKSIGRMKTFAGHFGIIARAYTYIRMHGPEGMRRIAEHAVLNANYLQSLIKDILPVPFANRTCMHEFVAEGRIAGSDIHALDISKRLIDYGFHPPTNYFPLIVPEALMIEPTETENKATLDSFVNALSSIVKEAKENPELLHTAPHNSPVARLDEVKAAKELVLTLRKP
ncbi:MAG: aminomethyl-transferring glycine dehydrogenase subunit GcvPB [Anaerolineales bacterium]|nr:aminomethyl-transferring glycine dehydrogenase subunit GcvPB [Anaerolineales bacterium]